MYGLVNRGIQDLVIRTFGEDVWNRVKAKAGVDVAEFESLTTYPDDVTYRLVGALSETVNMSAAALLRAYGKFWILYTAQEGYGDLMNLFGRDLRSCLVNLNTMHSRMGAMMPALKPPRFNCHLSDAGTIEVEYYSLRPGLAPMVLGLFEGLAEKFGEKAEITHLGRDNLKQCELFSVRVI